MSWIRQPAGKALEWIGVAWVSSGNTYASSVQGQIDFTRDNSNSMVYLQMNSLITEDSAVYYCAQRLIDTGSHRALTGDPKKRVKLNLPALKVSKSTAAIPSTVLPSREPRISHTPSDPPDTILPRACLVASVVWEVESAVRRAQSTDPDPGAGPLNRLYVPSSVRSRVLQRAHAYRFSFHPGMARTLFLLRQWFWWPAMDKDCRAFVAACKVCACAKPSHPPVCSSTFRSNGNIRTVVDRFSKSAHFVPLPKLPTSLETARLLIDHVFRLHGIPLDIVSDRGPQFTTASISSGYHPQTNGQTERVNQDLGMALRCVAYRSPTSWSSYIPWIEYAHNSQICAATDFGGRPGRLRSPQPPVGGPPPDPCACLPVGQQVWLSSKELPLQTSSKTLTPRFIIPYPIEAIINPSAVRLTLPPHLKVHPVFHVSRIKPVSTSSLSVHSPPSSSQSAGLAYLPSPLASPLRHSRGFPPRSSPLSPRPPAPSRSPHLNLSSPASSSAPRTHHCDAFDYWGRGTEVTVSTGTPTPPTPPTLFPLVQCQPGSGDKITVGCFARDFYPKSLTFQWTDASGTTLTSENYPPTEKNNKYTGVSLVKVSKSDWDSRKSFKCSVNHNGSPTNLQVQKPPPKVTLLSVPSEDTQALVCTIECGDGKLDSFKWKKNDAELNDYIQSPIQRTGNLYSAVSVLKVNNADWDSNAVYTCEVTYRGTQYKKKASKAPVTVTLNQPSAKGIFNNKQAKLECIITGQDETIVSEIQITWQINERGVTNNIAESTSPSGVQHSKTSTMTRSLSEWQKVNKVRCSAIRDDMTPVIQDLTVHKGEGKKPNVTVHVLPEEDINKGAEVSLVCLVSGPVLQDYYIAWSEGSGNKAGIYMDGINFPPQKTQQGYLVTSVYTTTKEKWDKHNMFYCNVWPAGTNESMKTSHGVSKAQGNSIECD
ncbi:uncharacterized protein LOC123958721 [Micropterus dolomieu]|uniref:uncharacterized protein LOC123958721 n=1 Tax=Micropterus dolomieu TaxID=147949 RepID=UPI001E8E1475|nr:uncharacterized protein LOC123958721 [Micropterus dolomieu]